MEKEILQSKRKATRIFVPANSVVFLVDQAAKIGWIVEADNSGYKIMKPVQEVKYV